jgi:hypothetical protein
MRMRTSFVVISVTAVMLSACEQSTMPIVAGIGGTATIPPGNISTNIAPLVITPTSVQLRLNGVFQFSTNAPTTLQNQVEWSSLASTIVTVSPTGLVNAVGLGTAIITARYSFDTTRVARATVTVNGPNTATGGMSIGPGVP